MPRTKSVAVDLDFTFFQLLWSFYRAERGTIQRGYRELTRRFLAHNDQKRNSKAFLRQPQFEALEIYVFLKESLGNARVHEIFRDWHARQGRFASRGGGGVFGDAAQGSLIADLTKEQYQLAFDRMRRNERVYPNYIFALTMGTGKTILMATCIFYEFLLANKWPKDDKYCHNALVFAPDKTVLQSLREIQEFDLSRVVPDEYASFLRSNLHFHYLDEAGTALSTIDRSKFNIIVSNTQKIILKRQRALPTAAQQLFQATKETFRQGSVYDENADLYDSDEPEDEGELATNQRFEKLCRLEQLGVYVDEAHHAFGKALARDMGVEARPTDTSLRTTIDLLAGKLKQAGTQVVACYNYTGTPYVGRDVLPEVVYAYGLREAIQQQFLKQVRLHTYRTTKDEEFVRLTVDHFLEQVQGLRPEGKLPKLAFFAAKIEELEHELRPAVQQAIGRHGLPASSILVNVGDEKLTGNDEIREFNRLDQPDSDKQFILLVGKGREGWNCRSLFGVGLFREPKSKIFVLQATMRCLRSIGEQQHTGQVYLSEANKAILDDELQANFRMTVGELEKSGESDSVPVDVKVLRPHEKVTLKRIRQQYTLRKKKTQAGLILLPEWGQPELWALLTERFRLIHTTQNGLSPSAAAASRSVKTEDLTHLRERVIYAELTLVAEIARYLHISPLEVEELLDQTTDGLAGILAAVNEFNELLYDVVIPRLFKLLFLLEAHEEHEERDVFLVREPPNPEGCYHVRGKPHLTVRPTDPDTTKYKTKSFNLSAYCFDSNPEAALFKALLKDPRVESIFFTGMLTHGQSEFLVPYIDPELHTLRSYFPDFVVQKKDGSHLIVEVKGDNQIDDAVVQAKANYARQIASASGMTYRIIRGTEAQELDYEQLFAEKEHVHVRVAKATLPLF